MAQYCPQMSCVPSTRGECPPRAVLGGHPPCRPRALQHPRGPPRVGWSLGCRGLHSGAAIPHTLSASPGPAFPCTGQPVQGRATQKHGRVSTLKCLNHSNLLRPLALLDTAVRCLPPLCELCGACRLGSKGRARIVNRGVGSVRALQPFPLQGYEAQPGCRRRRSERLPLSRDGDGNLTERAREPCSEVTARARLPRTVMKGFKTE